MAQQILEGTWKEVSERAHDLPEEQPVRLTILHAEETLPARPNEAMLEALRKVRERAKGMPDSGSTEETLKMIRDARGATPEGERTLIGRGKYAHVPGGSESFNEEKAYEIAREVKPCTLR